MEIEGNKRHRSGIFWPLLLIIAGIVLLLNTLGTLQSNPWDLFVRFWPVLFMISGLDHIIRGEGWGWGLISISLGLVFLAANLGYLPWNSLDLLLRLWPLLLIAGGLDLIFKEKSWVASTLGVLLTVGMLAVIAWYLFFNGSNTRGITQPIQQELKQVQSANIRLANAAGMIQLSGGASTGTLIEGTTLTGSSKVPTAQYEASGRVGTYSLTAENLAIVPLNPGFNQPEWKFKVTDTIPLNLEITIGAGKQNLDLTGMDIDHLEATVALGELIVTLPEDDAFEGTISNPVGSQTIHIPRGTLVEITLNTAITERNFPPEFTREGDILYSPGATASNAQIRLQVEQPIGNLTIQWVP